MKTLDLTLDLHDEWKRWVLVSLFSLLIHGFFAVLLWILQELPRPSAPIELEWITLPDKKKAHQQRTFLLHTDSSQESEKKIPQNARYESDRTHSVEKEQQAQITHAVPKPGGQPVKAVTSMTKSTPMTPSKSAAHLPSLKNLGVPFHLHSSLSSHREKTQVPERLHSSDTEYLKDDYKNAGASWEAGSALSALGSPHSNPSSFSSTEELLQNSSITPKIDQTLLDPSLPFGTQHLLNTYESMFYSFYARLYQAVVPIWEKEIRNTFLVQEPIPGDYITETNVHLDSQGTLIRAHLVKTSGNTYFDHCALLAWEKIGHFPNPPRGLRDQKNEIHTGWTFRVHITSRHGLMQPR